MSMIRCPGCMKEKTQSVCEHCGWDEIRENAAHQLPIGTVLTEQYRIGRALGQGGFGITYLGWDLYLDMPVAIKEYYPSSTVMRDCSVSLSVASYGGEAGARFRNCRERFLREAKILARLSDVPEIVKIRNFFEANNTAYIVMEFVRGVTLKDYVKSKGKPLTMEETLSILYPVMEGLCKVHKAGLVHRDISPDNIMLLPEGGAKLIDFGAVRDVGHADKEAPLTKSTEAILKQGYAPIEQYQNRGSLGPWTDVYAMCATVFYCITGQVPMDAPGRMLDDEGLKIRDFVPELSESLEKVLEQGMALRTVNRIGSMDELLQMLRNPESVTGKESEPPTSAPVVEKKRRSKLPLVIPLLLAIIVGVVLLIPKETAAPVIAQHSEPSQPPTAQETEAPELTATARWQDNTLREGIVFPANVWCITFLDSTDSAPEDALDYSEAQDGRVKAWYTEHGTLFIAANGGIRAPADCSGLFAGYEALERIEFSDVFHMELSTNASRMFADCPALKRIDLFGLDTSNIIDMSGMFSGCSSLRQLDTAALNTEKVRDMSLMFEDCRSLIELNLKRFDTACVTTMSGMFRGCTSLTSLDLSNFNLSLTEDMSFMFYHCCSLESVELLGSYSYRISNAESMFECCCSITALDLYTFLGQSSFNNCQRMFAGCLELKRVAEFRPPENCTDIILDCPYLCLIYNNTSRYYYIESK